MPGNNQAHAFLLCQNGNVVGGFACHQAVCALVNGLLQIAAACAAHFGQLFYRVIGFHKLAVGVQHPAAGLGQLLGRGGHVQRADAAAVIGEITAVLNAQQVCQHIVHTTGSGIQIGVHADGRNAVLQQHCGHILRRHAAQRVKDDRVVAYNQLTPAFGGIAHHIGGNIQRRHNGGDRASGIHQKAHVIPTASQLRRGDLFQNFQYLLYFYGHSPSSISCIRASTPSACGPGARPRRYFFSLTSCCSR